MSLIDCLSTPLSIASLCRKAGISNSPSTPLEALHIICIGASSKAEGRVLEETNCFTELAHIFSNVADIRLHLVGPEMLTTSQQPRRVATNLHVSSFRGTSKEFFRHAPQLLLGTSTVVVGVNCGFGNWENPLPVRFNLLMQWLPDLYFLTGTKLPLLFTCANDYADLSGEVTLMMHIMGCYFIVPPSKNNFSYASTLIPPKTDEGSKRTQKNTANGSDNGSTDYSCGNSFVYGCQGHDKARRQRIEVGDVAALMRALQAPLLPIPSISRPLLPFGTSTSPPLPLAHVAVKPVVTEGHQERITPSETFTSKVISKAQTMVNSKKLAQETISDINNSSITADEDTYDALLREKAAAEQAQAKRQAALTASLAAEETAAAELKAVREEIARQERKKHESSVQLDVENAEKKKSEEAAKENTVTEVMKQREAAKYKDSEDAAAVSTQQRQVKIEQEARRVKQAADMVVKAELKSKHSAEEEVKRNSERHTNEAASSQETAEGKEVIFEHRLCTSKQMIVTATVTATECTTSPRASAQPQPTLQLLIRFHVPVASLADLTVDLHNESSTLRLGVIRSQQETSAGMSQNIVDVEHNRVHIPLLCRVQLHTVAAKFSKKRKELRLTAVTLIM